MRYTEKHMDQETLRERLSEEAYRVTQEGATEPAFSGKHYGREDDGMYRCVVCGEKLFDSKTKFNSSSGWPSFFDPENEKALRLREDTSAGAVRTEVSCGSCGAHLGHVFPDAPRTPTGQRYCINSCALSFEERDTDS